jgi:hypothetical protein
MDYTDLLSNSPDPLLDFEGSHHSFKPCLELQDAILHTDFGNCPRNRMHSSESYVRQESLPYPCNILAGTSTLAHKDFGTYSTNGPSSRRSQDSNLGCRKPLMHKDFGMYQSHPEAPKTQCNPR